MRILVRVCVALTGCAAVAATPLYDISPATISFLDALERLPHGAQVIVCDVGANNGKFSDSLMEHMFLAAPHVGVRVRLFEPQRRFNAVLGRIAQRWDRFNRGAYSVEVTNAIASDAEGNATLFSSGNPMAASTIATMAQRFRNSGRHPTERVRMVDLARILIDERRRATRSLPAEGGRTRVVPPLIYMKLDIEGGEYKLLPHLLVAGALCGVSYLRVEWHLNSQGVEQAGLPPCPHP